MLAKGDGLEGFVASYTRAPLVVFLPFLGVLLDETNHRGPRERVRGGDFGVVQLN